MDIPATQPFHARYRAGPHRRDDRPAARAPDRRHARRRAGLAALGLLTALAAGASATAETLRLAQYHADLMRRGPGLLLRDILGGEDTQLRAVTDVLRAADADIVLLQGIDMDPGGATLDALASALEAAGLPYPHRLTAPVNAGRPSGHDLDGDGRADGPRDAHGYGRFTGHGAMALLSRHPLGDMRDFSAFPWNALPGNRAASVTPEAALAELRLHTVAAWDVTVTLPDGPFNVLASHATPPVFDGPEDRNGHRNADELRFWHLYLDGWSPDGAPFEGARFALMGTFNVDPDRGEGQRAALAALLDHRALQDPRPRRPDGGRQTADWTDPVPGDLRVDYILPSAGLRVTDARVLWPVADGALSPDTSGLDA